MDFKKTCSRCHLELSILDFYRDHSKKDGKKTICKKCTKSNSKKYYEEHREHVKERSKQNQVITKNWKKQNKERIKSYDRFYKRRKRINEKVELEPDDVEILKKMSDAYK